MQVNLINGYYIDVTTNNFTLKQKYIGKRKDGTKKEAVKIHGHYGNIDTALESFLKLYQIDRGSRFAVDLMSYAYFINESNKEAVQALKSVLNGKESYDDVCEWFKYDYRTIAPKNHDVGNPYWRIPENMDKLKYCPYCGKKIKVVDNHEVN